MRRCGRAPSPAVTSRRPVGALRRSAAVLSTGSLGGRSAHDPPVGPVDAGQRGLSDPARAALRMRRGRDGQAARAKGKGYGLGGAPRRPARPCQAGVMLGPGQAGGGPGPDASLRHGWKHPCPHRVWGPASAGMRLTACACGAGGRVERDREGGGEGWLLQPLSPPLPHLSPCRWPTATSCSTRPCRPRSTWRVREIDNRYRKLPRFTTEVPSVQLCFRT
jgi:hypothetical protein